MNGLCAALAARQTTKIFVDNLRNYSYMESRQLTCVSNCLEEHVHGQTASIAPDRRGIGNSAGALGPWPEHRSGSDRGARRRARHRLYHRAQTTSDYDRKRIGAKGRVEPDTYL